MVPNGFCSYSGGGQTTAVVHPPPVNQNTDGSTIDISFDENHQIPLNNQFQSASELSTYIAPPPSPPRSSAQMALV